MCVGPNTEAAAKHSGDCSRSSQENTAGPGRGAWGLQAQLGCGGSWSASPSHGLFRLRDGDNESCHSK